MANLSVWFLSSYTLIAVGAQTPQTQTSASPTLGPLVAANVVRDAQTLADRIDNHLAQGWQTAGVRPATAADDAEFLRRIYLDLAGRIPTVTEVRHFLNDKRTDKRQRIIDQLLAGPRYTANFSRVWRSLWLPEANARFELAFFQVGFEDWIKSHLAKNSPYDVMVRELLTMPLASDVIQRLTSGDIGASSPLAYYFAKDSKADELAAGASRLFLGVNLQCAQCHKHPFAKWKKEQFWNIAAFFAGMERSEIEGFSFPAGEVFDRREIKIPETETIVPAAFLDGTRPKFKDNTSPRDALAEWITADANPYFARAAVNRLWSFFFGVGLVDPVDDMVGDEAKASHPALLDELAQQFIAHRYDLKYLIRAITSSKAYQLTSSSKNGSVSELAHFARMPLRGMSPEQLFDSVAQATGYQERGNTNPFVAFNGGGSQRAEFLTRFASLSEKATETQTSILHALALMNGKLIADATSLERSETLAAIVDAPFMDTADRIETLFLATLSRLPRPDEMERFVRYVDNGGTEGASPVLRTFGMVQQGRNYNRAMSDVFWVLLNNGEFILNH